MAVPDIQSVVRRQRVTADPKSQIQRQPVNTIRHPVKLPWLNRDSQSGQVSSSPVADKSLDKANESSTDASKPYVTAPEAPESPKPRRKPSRSSAGDTNLNQTFLASGTSSSVRTSEASTKVSIPSYREGRRSQRGKSIDKVPEPSDNESRQSKVSDPFKDPPDKTKRDGVYLLKPDPALRPYSSTQTLARVSSKPRGRQWNSSASSRPYRPRQAPTRDASAAVQRTFGHKPLSGQYTPSAYDSTPPTECDMPATLPRKDAASYEKLVKMPSKDTTAVTTPQNGPAQDNPVATSKADPSDAAKSPTWPMVPLAELDIDVPVRMSSLRSSGPPSSIGRYNDGTISRKPTIRRIATMKSPEVSPKTEAPPSSSSPNSDQQTLERTVTGLQDLMQEALTVAKEAAQNNRTTEVAQILDEATLALRKANTVHGHMTSPLRISDTESSDYYESDEYVDDSDSDADVESNVSSIQPRPKVSNDTIPTAYTKSKSGLSLKTSPMAPATAGRKLSLLPEGHEDKARWGERYSVPAVDQSAKRSIVNPPFTVDGRRPTSEKAAFGPSSSESQSFSMTQTPPRMYQKPSADSIVTDWAYVQNSPRSRDFRGGSDPGSMEPSDFTTPSPPKGKTSIILPPVVAISGDAGVMTPQQNTTVQPARISMPELSKRRSIRPSRSDPQLPPVPTQTPQPESERPTYGQSPGEVPAKRWKPHQGASRIFESPYYHLPQRQMAPGPSQPNQPGQPPRPDATSPDMSLKHPRKNHISLKDNQHFGLHRYRRQPIAREWKILRKRITAAIACVNTALPGLIAGIYAGEVPKIQYQMGDEHHRVILGNVLFYVGMGITTLIFWPLPLLHGRRPYTLAALALAVPLQFPQAIVVTMPNGRALPHDFLGLLLPRVFLGLALGFAHINFLTTLFDLFGASLQSRNPHQEIVVYDDIRRQGGGMGLWLGIWSFCFVGSLSIGFLIGAEITQHLSPSWGFYMVTVLLAFSMLVNVVAPETRRAPYRRSVLRYMTEEEQLKRRVARGEVKLHLSQDGPKYWWEEVWAGIKLMGHMLLQPGFLVLAIYLAWIYALVVLITLLLGALLSRNYDWQAQYIGLAVFAVAVGALLAVPLTKANIFSRDRVQPARTDSMTFEPRVTWTSHLLRRCLFTFALPIAGLGYVLASPGRSVSSSGPIVLSGIVGFLSCLAIAECVGLAMEAFDTSDLQPGINTKHRLLSMESVTKRRRTNYSSFPRVCAGLFAAQGLGFLLAAAATGVSGAITRAIGAQAATGVMIGILLFLTILLSIVMWRHKSIQVIPNQALGSRPASKDVNAPPDEQDEQWRAVVIGNPSGKMRRMNLLEMGSWSRWTEIRKLNKLIKDKHYVG